MKEKINNQIKEVLKIRGISDKSFVKASQKKGGGGGSGKAKMKKIWIVIRKMNSRYKNRTKEVVQKDV
ncbi:hypothetical protein ACFP2G_08420 [Psittacicella hinzii]